MSLTKIPFILLATWAFHTSTTSPNPPASKDERLQVSGMPLENATFVHLGPFISRFFQLVFCAAEVVTILASANPSSPLSQPILSMLLWNGARPESLRMSRAAGIGVILMASGTWIRKDHELIVSGPYAIVRHPSYAGLLILFIGWFFWQMSEGSWIIESGLWDMILGRSLVLAYIGLFIIGTLLTVLARIPKEDAALRKHFGTKWDDWVKDVPYAIIPGIY